MNRLNEIAERCSAPFARDAELKTEIENEVNDHLASAAAEVGEEEAVRRFGDPEPVAQELLLSNFNRLKWRLRFKLAVKILIVPAVLASVFFCVSRDLLGGMLISSAIMTDHLDHASARQKLNWAMLLSGRPDFSDEQYRALCCRMAAPAELRAAFEKSSTALNCEKYILALMCSQDVSPDEYERALRVAIEVEPDNALYYFLLCHRLFAQAVTVGGSKDGGDTCYTVKDRKLLDQSMRYYLEGTAKPYMRMRLSEIYIPGRELFPDDGTFSGWLLQLTHTASWPLPYLSPLREVSREALWYAELLLNERDPRAKEFLNGRTREALLLAKSDDPTLITQLGAPAILGVPNDISAALHEDGYGRIADELARQEAAARAPHRKIRGDRESNFAQIKARGGICGAILLRGLGSGFTREQLWPERKFTMAASNNLMLMGMEVAVVGLIAVLVVVFAFAHRGVYLMVLPSRTYLRLLVFGAALPLAVWMLCTYALYRAPLAVNWVLLWSCCMLAVYLVWFMVLAVLVLAKRYRRLNGLRLPFRLLIGNLIVLLAGFVAVNTLVMRPWLGWMQTQAMREDRVVLHSSNAFTPAEDNVVAVLRDEQIKVLEALVKQPIMLDEK